MSTSLSTGNRGESEQGTAAPPENYLLGWVKYFSEYVPGVSLLCILALLARFLGHTGSGSYYLIYAILFGILVRNLLGLNALFEPGSRTYELFWKVGIILLGSQMSVSNFRNIGAKGLSIATAEVLGVMALVLLIGPLIKVSTPLLYLLAIGMGICGVSAVVALAATLRTDEEDTSYAISVILLFGLLALILMPVVGNLIHLTDLQFGLWAGLSVTNTAEAVAAGFVYSEGAGHYSTLAKLCRNLYLGIALVYFAQRIAREEVGLKDRSRLRATWTYFPKFALGLVLFSCLATLGFWSPGSLNSLKHLYSWAFLLGFAGVGLRTDLRRLAGRGCKALAFGFGVQTLVMLVMLGCVLFLF